MEVKMYESVPKMEPGKGSAVPRDKSPERAVGCICGGNVVTKALGNRG